MHRTLTSTCLHNPDEVSEHSLPNPKLILMQLIDNKDVLYVEAKMAQLR